MDFKKTKREEGIQIRGMMLQVTTVSNDALAQFPDFSSHMKHLIKSSTGFCGLPLGLKIFVVGGNYLNKQIAKFSKELIWVKWSQIPHENLPPWLALKNLGVLELFESPNLLELWKDGADSPGQLRELFIRGCTEFRRFPRSIGCLKHLRKRVTPSSKVSSLPEEFCRLQSLEHLNLSDCTMLSSLPTNFGSLTNLRHLDLGSKKGYSELRMLPNSFKQLTLLQYLDLSGCRYLILQSDILTNITKLEYLSLTGCVKVEELPRHITNQACLRVLHLSTMYRLREVPVNIGELRKLQVMSIGSSLLTSLPTSLGNLSCLTSLEISRCELLTCLPTSIGNLSSLRRLVNLQTLHINSCPVSDLAFGQGSFTSSLCNLKHIKLIGTSMPNISISEDCCPCLETLQVSFDDNLKEIENLPTTIRDITLLECKTLTNIRVIGSLINLLSLSIEECPELDVFPIFQELTSLKIFELKGCNKVEKIEGLQHCISLEELVADDSLEVLGLENLEYMENLRTLQLKVNKRSDVGPYIQRMQKWPGEVIIYF